MSMKALQRREVLNPQPRTINRLTLANSTAPDSPAVMLAIAAASAGAAMPLV